jgi:hypothetical protein
MTTRPAPKPQKPVRGTAEARRYMAAVAQLACICCGRFAVQVHHAIHGRFSQGKASDFDTLPICPEHHDMLHQRPGEWKRHYGSDFDYLPAVKAAVERIRAHTIGGRP